MRTDPNTPKRSKKNDPFGSTLQLFLASCAAEIYVLAIRRYYINGTVNQVIAWDDVLKGTIYVGLAVAAVGLILGLSLRKAGKAAPWVRHSGWWVMGLGLFLTASGWISREVYATGVTMMCVVVPMVMLLGILWLLYERECFMTLSILGASILAVWICRHGVGNLTWNTYVLVGAVVYLILLGLIALATRKAEKSDGKTQKFRILPSDADTLPIYVSCGVSAVAVAISLFSTVAAYYIMWTLAVIIFALAVYYTVRQL